MEDIIVRYKWSNDKKSGDLVCSLTEFIDNYLLFSKRSEYMYTYLYNDLEVFSTNSLLQIAFRYPRSYKRWYCIRKVR